MEQPYFKVKRLDERARLPVKREEDAGYDFYACMDESFRILYPGDIFLAPTKISVEIPKNWVLYIAERGSTGSKGLAKRCGVVDSGYRGEIFIALNNTSNKPIVLAISEGEALDRYLEEHHLAREKCTIYLLGKGIAQGMLLYAPHAEVEEVEELDVTSERGEGRLGASGK